MTIQKGIFTEKVELEVTERPKGEYYQFFLNTKRVQKNQTS